MAEVQTSLNTHVLQKVSIQNKQPNKTLFNMQDFFSVATTKHTEKSNVEYLKAMDAAADNKDTIYYDSTLE